VDNLTLTTMSEDMRLRGERSASMGTDRDIHDDNASDSEMEHHAQEYRLDLSRVQPTLMVPEVTELLLDVLTEKELAELVRAEQLEESYQESGGALDMAVTYQEFRQLVLKCMERRGKDAGYTVLGRSYVYVPRKRTEVINRMVKQELANETFTPRMPRKSAEIVRQKGRDTQKTPIETKLLTQGQKQQRDRELLIKQKKEQEMKENTFKPQLFKPPKGLQPRYRGSQPAPPQAPKEPAGSPLKPVPKLSGKTLAKIAAGASPAVHSAHPPSTTYGELFLAAKSPVRPAHGTLTADEPHVLLISMPVPVSKPAPLPLSLPMPPQPPFAVLEAPPAVSGPEHVTDIDTGGGLGEEEVEAVDVPDLGQLSLLNLI